MENVESLKYYSLLFDITTGLRTLPFHLERIRSQVERFGRLHVIHFILPEGRDVESRMGWEDYETHLARLSELLTKHCDLHKDYILTLNAVGGDEFTLFTPDTCAPVDLIRELEEALFPHVKGILRPLMGHATFQKKSGVRWERNLYSALTEARVQALAKVREHERSLHSYVHTFIHNSDFSLHFQPIVNLLDQNVLGRECLLRLAPNAPFTTTELFFAYTEKTTHITTIESMIWRQALETFPFEGDELLFFNITPLTLLTSDWLESVKNPDRIVLEITERVKIPDWTSFRTRVTQLQELGLRIALDDVGSGYGSLQAILEIQPEFIKIDHSLVRGVDTHPIKRNLIVSLLETARELPAEVIAENIETESELATLIQLGVSLGQGFCHCLTPENQSELS
ncbi:MAG TPA: EAL domain-containing protein [Thermoanaerobaculia bacterium]|nr:EAL domain-containing protein [Thermoanaerobaculia bacterium]HUM30383.1 EAL domain-containing protein [Thermoanaerobaculia bacterium]HXK68606.1 EAL domain-containing protein [Thermoanaerobaculia bacterium]